LYFSEVTTNFYEFCNFVWIFGIYLIKPEKEKIYTTLGQEFGPKPQLRLASGRSWCPSLEVKPSWLARLRGTTR
jgi:hypothetical protein